MRLKGIMEKKIEDVVLNWQKEVNVCNANARKLIDCEVGYIVWDKVPIHGQENNLVGDLKK